MTHTPTTTDTNATPAQGVLSADDIARVREAIGLSHTVEGYDPNLAVGAFDNIIASHRAQAATIAALEAERDVLREEYEQYRERCLKRRCDGFKLVQERMKNLPERPLAEREAELEQLSPPPRHPDWDTAAQPAPGSEDGEVGE